MQPIVLGVIAGSIYALIAAGIALVYKATRVLNFAQAEVGTLSLYATWWVSTKHHQPWIIGAAASVGVAVVIGLLFERFIVRGMQTASRVTVSVATIGLFSLMIAIELGLYAGTVYLVPPPIAH